MTYLKADKQQYYKNHEAVPSHINSQLEWHYNKLEFWKKSHTKTHYSTMWSMKIAAVLIEDGAFALFFRPCWVFAIQGQNENANAWVLAQVGGRDGVVCIVPLGIDWCIMQSLNMI